MKERGRRQSSKERVILRVVIPILGRLEEGPRLGKSVGREGEQVID